MLTNLQKSKELAKELVYSVPYTLPLLSRCQDGFPAVRHVRLVLAKGKVFDIRCRNTDDTQRWADALTALWERTYDEDELVERQRLAHVRLSLLLPALYALFLVLRPFLFYCATNPRHPPSQNF